MSSPQPTDGSHGQCDTGLTGKVSSDLVSRSNAPGTEIWSTADKTGSHQAPDAFLADTLPAAPIETG